MHEILEKNWSLLLKCPQLVYQEICTHLTKICSYLLCRDEMDHSLQSTDLFHSFIYFFKIQFWLPSYFIPSYISKFANDMYEEHVNS